MTPTDLAFDHSVPAASADIRPAGEKLPFRLAVPLILGLSAGMWAGLWKLGTLLVGLAG